MSGSEVADTGCSVLVAVSVGVTVASLIGEPGCALSVTGWLRWVHTPTAPDTLCVPSVAGCYSTGCSGVSASLSVLSFSGVSSGSVVPGSVNSGVVTFFPLHSIL